jgi:hypothetical protein
MYIPTGTRPFPLPLCSGGYNKSYFTRLDGTKTFLGSLTGTSMLSLTSIRTAHTISLANRPYDNWETLDFGWTAGHGWEHGSQTLRSPSQSGETVRLGDFFGKPVVLFFCPKDDTLGCTREVCASKHDLEQFGNLDAEVIGISSDSVESHKAFAEKHDLPLALLSDEGVRSGSSMGCQTPSVCSPAG